jgi:hypothetical protein
MNKNTKPRNYIESLPSPQREIFKKLRNIVLETFPGQDEDLKLCGLWLGKYYIACNRDSVNLGFCVNGLKQKDKDKFEGKGRITRHLKFKTLEEIDENKIIGLLKFIDKNANY